MADQEQQGFSALMERVLAGCPEAAKKLVERYGPNVRAAVRSRLNRQLRPKYDSLDFVQDVWASFFANLPTENTFHEPAQLAAFLACVARNKVAAAVRRRLQGQKYNVNRESSASALDTEDDDNLVSPEPTPSEVLMGQEAWQQLLARQPLAYRVILTRVSEGRAIGEIVQELGISARTVRRVIQKAVPWLIA